jgi:hypothetical protein
LSSDTIRGTFFRADDLRAERSVFPSRRSEEEGFYELQKTSHLEQLLESGLSIFDLGNISELLV